eukprot:CAMPEP_0117534572 /NCGR_PEP_ID=MMETSP0784-20121206/40480_1 /TAXON_ID=39447 /ORGANISM="" /LENGTH=157 /DNA_ID=CAMNT_0005331055 /DNA_START=776 /DNA_END=1250 /DNA_ORIENTATION=+
MEDLRADFVAEAVSQVDVESLRHRGIDLTGNTHAVLEPLPVLVGEHQLREFPPFQIPIVRTMHQKSSTFGTLFVILRPASNSTTASQSACNTEPAAFNSIRETPASTVWRTSASMKALDVKVMANTSVQRFNSAMTAEFEVLLCLTIVTTMGTAPAM